MSTRFEYPSFIGHANDWLRVNPTENGVLWDNGVGPPATGYDTVLDNGVARPQRHDLDFLNYFTIGDTGTETTVDIDVVALAGDATFVTAIANNNTFITALVNNNTFTTALAGDTNFVTTLVANNTFTTALAGDVNFYTTLGNNTSFINILTSNPTFVTNITNIVNTDPSISIDLASQVTGVLPLGNGGTGSALSAPAGNRLWGWDNIDGAIVFINYGTNLSYDHATHTLNATGGGGGGDSMNEVITQVAHGFTVGVATPVRLTAGGIYVGSQALKTSATDLQAEVIGLAVAINANTFTLYYGGKVPTTQFALEDEGTPIYVDDAAPGVLTDVEPTAVGSVSKPVAYVNVPGTDLIMYNYRGLENLSSGVGSYFSTLITRAGDAVSGTTIIPHGLSEIPRMVRLTATKAPGSSGSSVLEFSSSNGVYDGANNNSVFFGYNSSSTGGVGGYFSGNDNTKALFIADQVTLANAFQEATVTVDITDITINWTRSVGAPINTTISVLVEAEV